jgi:hypothetical protein
MDDFLTPLIYLNGSAKWTIQLGLRSLFTEFNRRLRAVMAVRSDGSSGPHRVCRPPTPVRPGRDDERNDGLIMVS